MPRYYIQLAANSSFAGRDFAKQRGEQTQKFGLQKYCNFSVDKKGFAESSLLPNLIKVRLFLENLPVRVIS